MPNFLKILMDFLPRVSRWIRHRIVHWLLDDLHIQEQKFGTHSVTLGNLITMDSQTPTTAGQIGMNATTGTPLVYVSGASRAVIVEGDSRLSDKRTANALYDTTTTLAIGSIGDGEFLRRSGSTIISAAVNSAVLISAAAGMDIYDYGSSVSTIPNVISISGGTDV